MSEVRIEVGQVWQWQSGDKYEVIEQDLRRRWGLRRLGGDDDSAAVYWSTPEFTKFATLISDAPAPKPEAPEAGRWYTGKNICHGQRKYVTEVGDDEARGWNFWDSGALASREKIGCEVERFFTVWKDDGAPAWAAEALAKVGIAGKPKTDPAFTLAMTYYDVSNLAPTEELIIEAPRDIHRATCKRCGLRFEADEARMLVLGGRCEVCAEQWLAKVNHENEFAERRRDDEEAAYRTKLEEARRAMSGEAGNPWSKPPALYEAPLSGRAAMVGGIWRLR